MLRVKHFLGVSDDDKASLIRTLIQHSTPNFAYFYLVALSAAMLTFGLLLDNVTIVIGAMLIAPLMYPILSLALGLTMMSIIVLRRSVWTLIKSLLVGIVVAATVAAIFGDIESYHTAEVMLYSQADNLYIVVALIAGAAVSFVLTQREWSSALPGVAIAVALIPPVGAIGVGLAAFDYLIISGSAIILLQNLLGISLAAICVFSLMGLRLKRSLALSVIQSEDRRIREEEIRLGAITEKTYETHT